MLHVRARRPPSLEESLEAVRCNLQVEGEIERALVSVYTDGACRDNGTPDASAGYGVWFGDEDPRRDSIRYSADQPAGGNDVAMETVTEVPLRIHTDSKYVQNGATTWMFQVWWVARNIILFVYSHNCFLTVAGARMEVTIANLDLWRAASNRLAVAPVKIEHVKAHSGDRGNDGLAASGIRD